MAWISRFRLLIFWSPFTPNVFPYNPGVYDFKKLAIAAGAINTITILVLVYIVKDAWIIVEIPFTAVSCILWIVLSAVLMHLKISYEPDGRGVRLPVMGSQGSQISRAYNMTFGDGQPAWLVSVNKLLPDNSDPESKADDGMSGDLV
ncbi:hypothetical protein K435DRAFT_803943 [Dendrothele bispora CBS 962.96]|uniref:Uncharacterized protein n=1 Tax=Dendrothele bispora (strain CBS 962.96) TaxID=1314807 RepID=A0A4S8LFV2_DENBC|nr:hypothetical protein K435DRAFT_803943 [Dendrothele bispora CBS 962.96]